MDYHSLPRKDLQLLCKKHGIPANRTNVFMAQALAKKRIPLSDVSVNKEADNDLFSVSPLKVLATQCKGNDGDAALFNNTPFLRRVTKKKEGTPPKSSSGTEEPKEVRVAAPSRGTKLFEDGGCDPKDTSKEVCVSSFQRSSTVKSSSGSLKRDESKSGKSAKPASVKQKPEGKFSVLPKSAVGPLHQPETRRGGKADSLPKAANAATEKNEVKSFPSCAATTGALQKPPGECEPPAANADLGVNQTRGSKLSIPNSVSGVCEQDASDSSSDASSPVTSLQECDMRRLSITSLLLLGLGLSSSESPFTSADQEDLQRKKVQDSAKEAGFVNAAHDAQTYLSKDSNIELLEPELERSNTPPNGRYIARVAFADEVSIMGQGSAGAEKVKPAVSTVRRSDTSNGGYAVKSKLDERPATNPPFVFRASRQEETKPKRSRTAARETKAFTPRALKQDETKPRRAGSIEGIEALPVVKLKPEAKASNVAVRSSYSNPSKRPRLGSDLELADDAKTTGDKLQSLVEFKIEVADQSCDFSASSEKLKVLELKEWAKELKRKREDTLSSSSSVVADSPDGSANVRMVASHAPGLSPLKSIGDVVDKLLDRLTGFCWKAELSALASAVANDVQVAVEEGDQIEVEHTVDQQTD